MTLAQKLAHAAELFRVISQRNPNQYGRSMRCVHACIAIERSARIAQRFAVHTEREAA